MNILLCVTGGIASYKAIDLTSKLTQKNMNVRVVLSDHALEFVTPLSFQAISRNEVYTNTFYEKNPNEISHIALGEWADLVVVAPATANTIGKLANGIYDNLVLNVLAANTTPVMIAPAMNVNMYNQPAHQRNVNTLKQDGYHFLDSDSGFLACGYNAKGRLKDVGEIVLAIEQFQKETVTPSTPQLLKNKHVLITAGPTREAIDPVRYITNHSSGQMGYSIARAARDMGATVTLISGPVNISAPKNVHLVNVTTAEEMFEAVNNYLNADIGIFSAAVSDYTPVETFDQKVKKGSNIDLSTIKMRETKDILKHVGTLNTDMYVVGFAAETEHVRRNALKKLETKNADCIIMNDISSRDSGMNSQYNALTMLFKNGDEKEFSHQLKETLGYHILNEIGGRI